MPTTSEFRRLHRRSGIDRFAGLPPQFEPAGDHWRFRRHGHGPAIPLSDDEYAGFMRSGMRAILLHALALPVFGWLAWLLLERLLPGWSVDALAALFGVVLALIALALWGSIRHRADAPARVLAGRTPVAPPRDPDDAAQPAYATIAILTLLLLFLAAIGTRQPSGVYIAFASASVTLGATLAVRRWRFEGALTVIQRERLRERTVAARAAERAKAAPSGHWWQLPLFLGFLALDLALLAAGALAGVAIVLAVAGRPFEQLGFGLFALGFFPGLFAGYWLFRPLDRLCERWTGASAAHAFDWIPAGW